MKKGYKEEKERKEWLEEAGWTVYRVSGSIGEADLLAIRLVSAKIPYYNIESLFEIRLEQVKSVRGNTFYFNNQSKKEWKGLYRLYKKLKVPCFFAIKFKRKGWKIVQVKTPRISPIKWS